MYLTQAYYLIDVTVSISGWSEFTSTTWFTWTVCLCGEVIYAVLYLHSTSEHSCWRKAICVLIVGRPMYSEKMNSAFLFWGNDENSEILESSFLCLWLRNGPNYRFFSQTTILRCAMPFWYIMLLTLCCNEFFQVVIHQHANHLPYMALVYDLFVMVLFAFVPLICWFCSLPWMNWKNNCDL